MAGAILFAFAVGGAWLMQRLGISLRTLQYRLKEYGVVGGEG